MTVQLFIILKIFLDFEYGDRIKTYVADAGYSTAAICHDVQKDNKEIIVPKKDSDKKRNV